MCKNETGYSYLMSVFHLTIFVIFVLASNNSMAEWSQLSIGSNTDVYADLSTIKKSGNFIKIWSLHDYETKNAFGDGLNFSSIKSHDEFDCSSKTGKNLANIFYSNRMGQGKVISSSDKPLKIIIFPGTVVETIFRIACLTNIVEAPTDLNKWSKFKSDSSGQFYFDSSSIQRNGSNVRVIEVYNFTKALPLWMALIGSKRADIDRTFQSISYHKEFDCQKKKVRTIYEIVHSDSMASGSKLYIISDSSDTWELIAEHNLLFDSLCKNHS